MTLTTEMVDNYFRQRPYYWTDGVHFRANLSSRKRQGWKYIGRFLDCKEAKAYYKIYQNYMNPKTLENK